MAYAALGKLKKNSPEATLTAGIDNTTGTIPVDHLEYFHDDDGTLIVRGIVIGPNTATATETEEITITGASGTTGVGNLTGGTRGVNADGTNGAAKAWDSGTVIKVTYTTGIHNQIKDNFAAHQTLIATQRIRLTGATTFYVATTGTDDPAHGLTSGTPWATIQYAYNYICANYDLGGQTVTIQLADGTYAAGVSIPAPWVGGGTISIKGNSSDMNAVTISTTTATIFSCSAVLPGTFSISYVKMQITTGTAFCIFHNGIGVISVDHVNFGSAAGAYSAHIVAQTPGAIIDTSYKSYTISGNAECHIELLGGARVDSAGATVTLSGTPAFKQFLLQVSTSTSRFGGSTFSGSATGVRYSVTSNSVCDSGGVILPGDTSGSTATGGQYI